MDKTEARYTGRKGVLERALKYTTQERNKSYGEPDEDFQRIAATLNALGYRAPAGRELEGHDVSVIMISLKLSRLTWQSTHQDSWDDIAGYAACGSETAALQEDRRSQAPELFCRNAECPNFGDPDFGEASCPEEHADPSAPTAWVAPKGTMVSLGPVNEMIDAAGNRALRGDPKELEDMGLILADRSGVEDGCGPGAEHLFNVRCAYAIRLRRTK